MEEKIVTNQSSSMITEPKDKPKSKFFGYILGLLAVFSISFFGGWLGAVSQRQDPNSGIIQQKTILTNESNLLSEIASTVGPSVVSINVTSETSDGMNNPYSYWFGFGGGRQTQRSAGTGIILNKEGLILTNRHVIPTGTTKVSVTLSDGTVLDDVTVIGRTGSNDSMDIAFLKIGDKRGAQLVPAQIGDSSAMKVGDTVVAIGNALGQFQNTVTSGIISGYGRSVQASDGSSYRTETLDDMFQTDAAINQGNSGGPLVNLSGEVIGVNTAVAANSEGVGFAIPINNVKGLMASVEKNGKLERPYLGVMYVMLTDDIAKEYNLKVKRGAYIPYARTMGSETVVMGGPAAEAGLKEGDVITKIDGTSVDEKNSITSLLGKKSVGDKVALEVQRGDSLVKLEAILGEAPEQ